MKFRNGSLLLCISNASLWLIENHKARQIKNPDVLKALNAKYKDAVWISQAELNLHEKGNDLNG